MGDLLGTKTQTTTSAYASVLKVELHSQIHKVTVHLVEKNVNAVKYKILASNDDVTFETLQAETVIAKNGSDWQTLDEAWRFIDVQAVDSVAETHGSIKVTATGN